MIFSKNQAIAAARSELMYENDWMDYAEAHQAAHDMWEYYGDLSTIEIEEDEESEL